MENSEAVHSPNRKPRAERNPKRRVAIRLDRERRRGAVILTCGNCDHRTTDYLQEKHHGDAFSRLNGFDRGHGWLCLVCRLVKRFEMSADDVIFEYFEHDPRVSAALRSRRPGQRPEPEKYDHHGRPI